jgi:methyltransferase (TIGR00027 family)
LKEAVAKGIQRYVLIGAGYDTFALRQPSWAHVLKIVEVDHPATQAAKLERIAKAGLSEPDNVILASVDFEREELSEALTRCGVGHQEPVFFSWLGVSMYLEEAAIDATLRVIASYAPGSQVSMTFKQPSGGTVSRLADKVSGVGEPFMSFYTPEQIEDKLRRFEFSGVEFLTPEKSKDLYFTPARTDLPLPKRTDTLCATVAG